MKIIDKFLRPLKVRVESLARRIAWRVLGVEAMPTNINKGDWVNHPRWTHGPVQIVDVNWALRSVAIRLGENGGIVVWPMRNDIRKVYSA